MMKKLILVAEDEPHIRDDISRILQIHDYDTLTAVNGREALNIAQREIPDLIISDVMMPDMDGYDLLDELQKEPRTISIPFLFLTAKSERTDVRHGMQLGADDYITKPFVFEELIAAVESRLKKKEISENKSKQTLEDLRANITRSVPHEIRTPLNIILGFSDYLMKSYKKTSEEETIEIISHIHSSAQRLNHMFEKYILYTNLELISSNPIELKNLISEVTPSPFSAVNDIAMAKADEYERIDEFIIQGDDIPIRASQEYFAKAISEILDNSFKYSNNGTVIAIKLEQIEDRLEISFTDKGRGMSKEQIASIGAYIQFERMIYEQQGTGLGIAIAKKIVELYGGEFSINSLIEKFTTIKIYFPISKVNY
jgi:two-component system, sensor histidine kinase and response regulator